MKFGMMKACAASFGSTARESWLMYCSIWPSWFGSRSLSLDERDQIAVGMAAKIRAGKHDGAQEEAVAQQVARTP